MVSYAQILSSCDSGVLQIAGADPSRRGHGSRVGELMRRAIAMAVMLAACSRPPKEPSFPGSIAPSWTRSAMHSLPESQFPRVVRDSGIHRGWEAEYRASDGAVAIVSAYAVQSNTQGLDLVQRWRPERNNAQFYTDHFVLNVAWREAKHDELAPLVRSLPKLVEGQ